MPESNKKRLSWDEISKRFYETGVSQVALYPVTDGGIYGTGVAWSGISSIAQTPSGGRTECNLCR